VQLSNDVERYSSPAQRDDAPSASAYPRELETDIVQGAAIRFHLRPIRSDDEQRLLIFHRNLSVDSIYRRYFSFHPELSRDEVEHLTHVDSVDRLALVIEDGDVLVGVGRYERYPGTSEAEVAFVVRDDYQHLGLGHRLFASLARAAWPRGITTFRAETLCQNREMMAVFRHSGFPMTTSASAGEYSVCLSIDPHSSASVPPSPPTFRDHRWS
jgi:GNAT superfamily N-acetyltransferase